MNRRVRVTIGIAAVATAPLAGMLWFSRTVPSQAGPPPVSSSAAAAARADAGTPFGRALSVLARGGSNEEVNAAIGFLDTCSRLGDPPVASDRATLITALARGAPSGMVTGTWAHLFNSACNALSANGTPPDPALVSLLERLAADSSVSHIMRLYALQHLGARYPACDEDTRGRIRTMVANILADPASSVAGTALVLSRGWENPANSLATASSGSPNIFDSARRIAINTNLSVDVRVTALHVAGDDPAVLGTARTLAADTGQPIILRKVAVYLIGRHGITGDLPLLRNCSAESLRMAQAADPASHALQIRLNGTPQPVLTPY